MRPSRLLPRGRLPAWSIGEPVRKWPKVVWALEESGGNMRSLFESIYYDAAGVPGRAWQWFNGLNREEWLVVLAITFATGFVALLGFQTRRL